MWVDYGCGMIIMDHIYKECGVNEDKESGVKEGGWWEPFTMADKLTVSGVIASYPRLLTLI